MATVTWNGLGIDENWSTPANWDLGVVPTGTDDVVFDGTSSKNCTIDSVAIWNGGTLSINVGYGGTLTQVDGITVVFAAQRAGTWNVGSAQINAQAVLVAGGTFNGGSGNATFVNNFQCSGPADVTASSGIWTFAGSIAPYCAIGDGVTFNHNGGTILFVGGDGPSVSGPLLGGPAAAFNIVEFQGVNAAAYCGVYGYCSIATLIDNDGTSAHVLAFDPRSGLPGAISIDTFSVSGSPGKLVSLQSTSPGNFFQLTSGAQVSCDYLDIADSHVDASPAWYAGSHSTNSGGNTNWIFGDPGPSVPGEPVNLPGTTLYFPAAEAAAVTPPLADGWDRISEAGTYRLSRSRSSENALDDLTDGSVIGPWSPGQYALDRRYISDEIETQLISGSVALQVMMEEVGSTFQVTSALQIYVIKADGTVRGELAKIWRWAETSESSDSYGYRNKTIIHKPVNSVFAKKGDRIVVCVGHTDKASLGGSAKSLWGVNGPGSTYGDLPDQDETQQNPHALPWINFSRQIYFVPFVPNPGVFESTTDKSYSFPRATTSRPGTAVPELGVDERLLLVRPHGTPATGYTFTVERQLDGMYQRVEWWQHRQGGCGSFRLHLRDTFPEQDPAIQEGWEIHAQIRLPAQSYYRTWYRGVIRSCHSARGGNEVLTEIRGYGYVEQLNFIQVQKTYPKGMSVSDVVNDIINKFIKPHSRIVRPNDLYPTDDNGVDVSGYQLVGDTHFECSALKALKFLAELQGDREWGVDERRCIFFRNNSTIGGIKSFYLGKDTINMVGGGKAFDRLNQVKLQGKQFTGREFLKVRADPTDVTQYGLFERASEVPWVTHDDDANRWADNIIAQHEARESWINFTWHGVDSRIDESRPLGKCYYYGHDTSNEKLLLSIGKIQYVKGGFNRKGELREIGSATQQTDMHQPVLAATIYLGAWRKDLIEELERNVYDPLAALQGKLRQFRNPNSDVLFPSDGKVVGEPFALWCPTEQRATRWQWDGTEWIAQQQVRRGYALPSFGIFQGQEFFLITDITNLTGTLYWWDGSQWKLFGEGTGTTSTYDLVHDVNFWMFSG